MMLSEAGVFVSGSSINAAAWPLLDNGLYIFKNQHYPLHHNSLRLSQQVKEVQVFRRPHHRPNVDLRVR